MKKYVVAATTGVILALSATSWAGSIERALGGDRVAHRTLESLATSDLNSRALDSFVRGVEQLARNPDLASLPRVQVGRRTVSLEGLSPLVEMARRLKDPSTSLSTPQSSGFGNLNLGSTLSAPSAVQNLSSPFSSLELAIEASPLPTAARSDLTRMVRSIKEFSGAK